MGLLDRFKKNAENKAGKKSLVRAASLSVKPKESAGAGSTGTKSTGHVVASDIMHILRSPVASEKSAHLADLNQYVFAVHISATKPQIKSAVRAKYGQTPTSVQVMRVRGKQVTYGRVRGVRQGWKKAMVTMPKGKSLSVHEGV
ncbi:50S ribosomal protein L23 [Candidatus Uhrbacteria bacterium]|nr:50S ribosomal protein L23 [Candidatus Uhrbacteria bacterium]